MNKTNIVEKKELREVQLNTLEKIANTLMNTAGPYGSNTLVLHDAQYNEYTKDGYKVLNNIKFYDPIERSIKEELTELTRYIVKTVGDGTTSSVLLSYLIFKNLNEIQIKSKIPPQQLIKRFKKVTKKIQENIKSNGKEATLDDIFNIAYISTNGDEEIARNIKYIYEKFGMDVFIDVGTSITTENIVKSYDGLTLETGFSGPAYINESNGTCNIRNPRIYAFEDPIDTPEMMSFFVEILTKNITSHLNDNTEYTPTVILAPTISRDYENFMAELDSVLYSFDNNKSMKPPILIITGYNFSRREIYDDITRLCGCKPIKKYIDPKIQQEEIKNGNAPTLDNIIDWCGRADIVCADDIKTKFINPEKMFNKDEEGNNIEKSELYNGMLNFLESSLKVALENNEDANVTGNIKRRINSLKANMVEYLIGGVTTVDRDSLRDLVEDAVLNCRSAAKNGVGYGANFEGLMASLDLLNNTKNDIDTDIVKVIANAYIEIVRNLYSTSLNEDEVDEYIDRSINKEECPLNIVSKEFDHTVLSTIDSDIVILDTISKIITIMMTANQALLTTPTNNIYIKKD